MAPRLLMHEGDRAEPQTESTARLGFRRVVDVGGFFGMGARSVSMKFDDLTVLRKDGGDDLRIYIDATKQLLEAMPRYDG